MIKVKLRSGEVVEYEEKDVVRVEMDLDDKAVLWLNPPEQLWYLGHSKAIEITMMGVGHTPRQIPVMHNGVSNSWYAASVAVQDRPKEEEADDGE